MVDGREGPPKDGFTVPLRLHNVLLALAGRLDDSALSEARELVARSHLDDAAELVVGALVAGRITVRPGEQRELALVLELSRSDAALADRLTVADSVPAPVHRFSRDGAPDHGVAEALDRTLRVLPDVRSVHVAWRNTPAGSVPGPLPQRVVLVEVGSDANPPAVAFRVDDALRRCRIRAVVEVTGPGAERGDYHEVALAEATPVWPAPGRSAPAVPMQGAAMRSGTLTARDGTPNVTGNTVTGNTAEPNRAATGGRVESRWPSHAAVGATEPFDYADYTGGHATRSSENGFSDGGFPDGGFADNGFPDTEDTDVASAHEHDLPRRPVNPAPRDHVTEVIDTTAGGKSAEAGGFGDGPAAVDSDSGALSAEELAELENRVAQTTEMSPAELAQLRSAIADADGGRDLAGMTAVDLPELDLDDPQLSERDRELLRELHAELAHRERAEAAHTGGGESSWGGGFSRD